MEGLSVSAVADYLRNRLSSAAPLAQLAGWLHRQTDGHPFFLVQLVEDFLARGVLQETAQGWTFPDPATQAVTLPQTVRQLLTRQMDKLPVTDQHLLTAASIAGAEFAAATVAAAIADDIATVEERCEALARRYAFVRRAGMSEWPDGTRSARYGFEHALHHQLWHEHVTPTRHQLWHRRIGERLEAAYTDHTDEIAAELALHFEEGRAPERALPFLHQAAETALHRHAYQEALTYLTKGSALSSSLPDGPERVQHEISLQLLRGDTFMAMKGYGAVEAGEAYFQAYALCQRSETTTPLPRALLGALAFSMLQADFSTCQTLIDQIFLRGRKNQSAELLTITSYIQAEISLYQGKFIAARKHLKHLGTLALPTAPTPHQSSVWFNLRAAGSSLMSFNLWLLGYPHQGLQQLTTTTALTDSQLPPASFAFTLTFASGLAVLLQEPTEVQEYATMLLTVSREQGFAYRFALGKLFLGWALTHQHREKQGLAEIREGLTRWQASDSKMLSSFFLGFLAEAYGHANQVEQGLQAILEAMEFAEKTGEKFYQAELYRLQGELRLQQGQVQNQAVKSTQSKAPSPQAEAEAEACFRKAIAIAQQQHAKSWELRAVMSLVRLRQQQLARQANRPMVHETHVKLTEAHRMLSEVYHWFTEGFDTRDLQEAKLLLEELA